MERILRYSMAALVMALFVGCSHDMEYSQPSKEQVQKNVAEKLGIEIDPNQNWNASTAITANVSVNLGLDQEYYAFRTKAYGEIAREWCRENEIPYAEK